MRAPFELRRNFPVDAKDCWRSHLAQYRINKGEYADLMVHSIISSDDMSLVFL